MQLQKHFVSAPGQAERESGSVREGHRREGGKEGGERERESGERVVPAAVPGQSELVVVDKQRSGEAAALLLHLFLRSGSSLSTTTTTTTTTTCRAKS